MSHEDAAKAWSMVCLSLFNTVFRFQLHRSVWKILAAIGVYSPYFTFKLFK